LKKFEPIYLIEQISKLIEETSEENDTIANQFISGKIKLEEFLDSYLSKRELFYTRKLKKESFIDNLRN
jgi:hypothetical protein